MTDRTPTAEEAQKFGQWYGAGASPTTAPSADDGFMSSVGAGFKGAAKEATGWTGLAPEWSKSKDPQHSTAEWWGREATDLAPAAAIDIAAPELSILPFAGRLAKLANAGLNAGLKGAAGGELVSSGNKTEGEAAKTGAEIGAGAGMTRAAWRMLPGWAKFAAVTTPSSLAGLASLAHEMGGGGRYISPWAVHHVAAAAGALAGAAAKAPATTGAVGTQVENWLGGNQSQ